MSKKVSLQMCPIVKIGELQAFESWKQIKISSVKKSNNFLFFTRTIYLGYP